MATSTPSFTAFLRQLLDYHHQANQALGAFLQQHETQVPKRCLSLFGHLIQAHTLWNHRIWPLVAPTGVWEDRSPEQLLADDVANLVRSQAILDQKSADEVVYYHTMCGVAMAHSVADLLFHLVNHASYHRGQMVLLLKEAGLQAPVSDYVLLTSPVNRR
jgi:uncharacterized damage-inducible protein DinB